MNTFSAKQMIRRLLLPAFALLAGCDSSIVDQPLSTTRRLTILEGDGQVAEAGTTLPITLAVRLTDERNQPVVGASVRWAVADSAGGHVGPATVTDALGIARTYRILGAKAGTQVTTATADGFNSQAFTATGLIQGAMSMDPALVNAGLNQTDTVGSTLAPFRVLIKNHLDRPVAGVQVEWTTSSSQFLANTLTNADGIAEMTFTLGYAVTSTGVRARVPGLIGSPISFTATTTPGRTVRLLAAKEQQIALVNTSVRLEVWAFDAYDNQTNPGPIAWLAVSSGATIEPSDNAQLASLRLGNNEGVFIATATAAKIACCGPVAFSVTAVTARISVSQSPTRAYSPHFAPAHVIVPAGKTVAWDLERYCYQQISYYYHWEACEDHNLVFEDDPGSPITSPGAPALRHARRFTTEGVYRYRCTNHSTDFTEGMTGVVRVTGS